MFPLKSYQAVKPGKVELNSTSRHRGHRAAGHPRCRNRMFPLKIEPPPVCPSATARRFGLRQLRRSYGYMETRLKAMLRSYGLRLTAYGLRLTTYVFFDVFVTTN